MVLSLVPHLAPIEQNVMVFFHYYSIFILPHAINLLQLRSLRWLSIWIVKAFLPNSNFTKIANTSIPMKPLALNIMY